MESLGIQKCMARIYELALYIHSRYLIEESQNYCSISDEPALLANLKEKYGKLNENLNEFLFEFLRPYLEEKLCKPYE